MNAQCANASIVHHVKCLFYCCVSVCVNKAVPGQNQEHQNWDQALTVTNPDLDPNPRF